MIIHYIVEENIFVEIVYKLLEQQKILNVMLEIISKLNVSKGLRWQERLICWI